MWDKITRFAGDIFKGQSPEREQRAKKIESVMGVKPNLIDPEKEPNLVRPIAKRIAPDWADANYANPLNNTIAMPGYKPGQQPYVEAHEAGHLSWEDAGPAKLLGVSGRAVAGISDQLGKPPLLEAISGGLMRFDAAEEDRAERLSAKYGPKLGGKPENAPTIDSKGRSKYGDSLRQDGNSRIVDSIQTAVKPVTSTINSLYQWNTKRKQSELQPQIREAILNHRQISQTSDGITPELLKSSKNLDRLEEKYGDGFLKFVDTIK